MGRFVVIEGIDGAGTTTQAARLVARLRADGADVVATNEPTDLPIGRLIREVLRRAPDAPDRAALPWMFAADRCDHLARRVLPALERGAWVVSDRYLPSSLAYQSIEAPLALVDGLNQGFRAPDLLVMIEVPVDVALNRVLARGGKRELYEERAWLERITDRYAEVVALLEGRGWKVLRIDGTAEIEAIAASIAEAAGC